MKKVHCLGIVVVDTLSGPFATYPVPRVCSQVNSPSVRLAVGGGAANSASALGQMGIGVTVFSKVGKDLHGRFIIDELKKRKVNTSGIVISDRATTPFTFVGIHPDGERTFIHTPGANLTFKRTDLDEEALLNADILFYQDFWVIPGIDGKPAATLLKKARQRGVVTVLDECWGLGPNRSKLEMVLPFADYFLPSFDDLAVIYRGLSPDAMIRLLHAKGVRNVVLKMGKKGCLVSSGGGCFPVPSLATRIVDTTGAGDCFDAGFIGGLVHGFSDRESAIAGSFAAATCMAHIGGSAIIPTFQQWKTYKSRFSKILAKVIARNGIKSHPNFAPGSR